MLAEGAYRQVYNNRLVFEDCELFVYRCSCCFPQKMDNKADGILLMETSVRTRLTKASHGLVFL